MNFKSNSPNNPDYYNTQNNLGYSNVSRNYNRGVSPRSISLHTQIPSINMEADSEKSNSCSKINEKSSEKPKTASN